jgi:competence protein ComEC
MFFILLYFILNKKCKYIFFILSFLFIGFFKTNISELDCKNSKNICNFNEKNIKIEGIIIEEPKYDYENVKIILQNNTKKGRIQVEFKSYQKFKFGEIVKIDCFLETPENFEGFDYVNYLKKENIYSLCKNAKIEKTNRESKNIGIIIKGKIINFKNTIKYKIKDNYDYPYNAFITALILGDKSLMPDSFNNLFRRAGISHIIVVSGYHVALFLGIISSILSKLNLNKKKSFFVILFFLIFFSIMTGLSASVIRASIMNIFSQMAILFGRKKSPIITLTATATIMIFLNTKILTNDLGFQLSFLSTIAIYYLVPVFQKLFKKLPDFLGFKEAFIVSLSCYLLTFPCVFLSFKSFSVVSILTNILISPFLSLAFVLSLISIIILFLFEPLFFISREITKITLDYIILISKFLASYKFSYIELL